MKIDIEKIEEANLTIEEALLLVQIEYIRRGKHYPGQPADSKLYIKLTEEGILKVNADGYSVSTAGYQLFRAFTGIPLLKFKETGTLYNFKAFWEAYPINDAHGNWRKTRNLKSDKGGCLTVYNRIVRNGTPHETIMKALKYQIEDFKKLSVMTNRMSFMKNSKTWLNSKEYEIILEDMASKNITDSSDSNWTEEMV